MGHSARADTMWAAGLDGARRLRGQDVGCGARLSAATPRDVSCGPRAATALLPALSPGMIRFVAETGRIGR